MVTFYNMTYQYAANSMTIRSQYIAQPKPTAHTHVINCDPLPVSQEARRVRNEARMLRGSDEV